MYKANVQLTDQDESAKTFAVEHQKDAWAIDQETFDWDLLEIKDGSFHILKDHVSYRVELLHHDPDTKTFSLKINEALYTVTLQDRFDLLIHKLGMKASSSKVSEIKAPMPGLILEIHAEAGQSVKKGETLLILEAMKMENILKSPIDGTVKSIKVASGDNVEKNQVLLNFA